MYTLDSKAQPSEFGCVHYTMSWGVATLPTVGYADLILLTSADKELSGLLAILGLFGMCSGLLLSVFSKQQQEEQTTE
ncbi:hypothetical protein [Hymenobacter wooponensis]|uniref:Two pore domain potassium channel family protein n=1 Tax=Hymenobacter wooponensis TaxID=1525360 RepID=A0A4Z0MCW4_9BACT|nr:hypothetical protein [Hymenobacter wooponensis]TGD77168.1 hypothetical protein EU557_24360 [Hymenobacter wooponensis]